VEINYKPIGVIRSPHTRADETPIQPVFAGGIPARVEVFLEYEEGLRDIDGFSHIYLLYAFDRAGPASLEVTPYLGDRRRGVFATRAPNRPNPLGLSLVRLVRREGNLLHIEDVDILDGTPLLDIKPYVGRFDSREGTRAGWQEEIDDETARTKGRRGCRPAEPGDLPGILWLLEACALPTEGVAEHLDAFVVAESDRSIAGVGGLEPHGDACLLRSLAVAKEHRGRGLAGAICDRLEADAAARGAREIYLLTETAERYFSRRGYATVPRDQVPPAIAASSEFSRLCPASAVLMRRAP
jgi:tRNA-Thr(GGU) m(6)t(6)A37 methyltransferase TsaA